MAYELALIVGMVGLTYIVMELQKHLNKDNEYLRIMFYFVFLGFVLLDVEFLRKLSVSDTSISFASQPLTTMYWIMIVITLFSLLMFLLSLLVGAFKWLMEKVK